MKKNRITPTDIFLLALALILIGVSFYQTWLGIDQLFGSAALPLAIVLSALLLFLSFLLRNAKLEDKPVGGLMAIYIVIATLCFIANFNALYTRFMRTDIYSQELKMLDSSFDSLETSVASKFNYKYPPEKAQQVEQKKKQLIEQIQDPGNPGIGERAKSLINDIEKLLGEKVSILAAVKNDYSDLAVRMGKQIDSMIFNLSPQEAELKDEIRRGVLKYDKKIQDLTSLGKAEVDSSAEPLIEEAVNEYNRLGGKAKSVLGEEKFKFVPINSQTNEIGKIGYAFRHAIENFGIYPIIVLLGCLILDFLIPILIILIVKSDENTTNTKSTFSKRTGRTVLPTS